MIIGIKLSSSEYMCSNLVHLLPIQLKYSIYVFLYLCCPINLSLKQTEPKEYVYQQKIQES